jgi:PAS domain S-box-containing protein
MTEENPSRSKRTGELGSTPPKAGGGGSSHDDFFRHFTELVSRVLDAPVALVVLSRADALVVAGAVGLDGVILEGADNPLVSLLRRAAESREPVALKDLAVDPSAEARALVGEWGLRAAAAIPLPGDPERPRGVLGVLDRKARQWKDLDLRLLRDLGAAASATTHLLDRVDELASGAETLAEATRLLRGTLESLDVAVFVVRKLNRGVVECNRAAEVIFGYAREEILGSDTRHLHVDEEHFRRFAEMSDPELAEGRSFHCDFQMRRADGTAFPTRHVVTLLNPEMGLEGGVVSVVRDITQEVETKRELETSEARFRAVSETASDGLLTMDTRSRIVYANPAAHELFGYDGRELVGRKVTELMPEDMAERHLAGVARFLDTGTRSVNWSGLEFPARRADGSEFTVEVSFAEYEIGEKRYFTGIVRDVTERRRLEEQVRQAQRMEAVGRLAGGIAHDFNNLLTVIRGHSHILLDDLPAGSDLREHVELTLHEVDRASELTRQLLAFGRRQVLRTRVFDLRTVVQDLKRMLRRALPSRIGLRLETADEPCLVRADPNQLHHVALNLALNAGYAIEGHGEVVFRVESVRVSPEEASRIPWKMEPGTYGRLTVSDTGRGMTPEVRERIFEPFFTTKPVGEGSGLGLPMVYGVMKQSGGHILVESEPGEGTTVRLLFPRVEGEASELPPISDTAAPLSGTGLDEQDQAAAPAEGATILLVDDEPALRKVARRVLERAGHTVLGAGDGDEAWELVRSRNQELDLVVSDLVMPGSGGLELIRRLRERKPGLPCVLMSGYAREELPEAAGQPGTAFLQKPFSPQELERAIREALKG